MRNHHQPCSVTIPGPDPDRRHVQPQTGCAGRNRVTIRILGADRVRTHVFQGRSALADAARFLYRTRTQLRVGAEPALSPGIALFGFTTLYETLDS